MKKINLILDNSNGPLDDFDNITLNQIDTLFSCSVGLLVTGNLSSLPQQTALNTLHNLLDKLIPGGSIIFTVTNYKRTCYEYLQGNLNENQFFTTIKQINNSLNIADFTSYCNDTKLAKITEIKTDNDSITITLTKTNI